MDKAILVIDMPDSCIKCPVCASYQASAFSFREYWCSTNGKDVEPYSKPEWCPLMPAPEEQLIWYGDDSQDWDKGYNACLREILGEEDDE